LIWQKGREEHFEEDFLMDAILLISFIGLVTARVWYVLLNWREHIFLFDLVGRPGFSWHGALMGGILTLIFYSRRKKWPFYKIADLIVSGLVLGLIFAKIGLFFNSYHPERPFQFVFLLEAFFLVLLYRALQIFDKNYRTYEWYKTKRGGPNPGFLFLSFLICTSLIFLGAGAFQIWPQLFNFSQGVNLIIILVSLILFYYRSGRDLTIPFPSFKKREGTTEKFRLKIGMEAKK